MSAKFIPVSMINIENVCILFKFIINFKVSPSENLFYLAVVYFKFVLYKYLSNLKSQL